jgi:hypothetical protein
MSLVKRYIISLGEGTVVGNPVFCELSVTLTGSYNTTQELFWTQLGNNLGTELQTTLAQEGQGSSHVIRVEELTS